MARTLLGFIPGGTAAADGTFTNDDFNNSNWPLQDGSQLFGAITGSDTMAKDGESGSLDQNAFNMIDGGGFDDLDTNFFVVLCVMKFGTADFGQSGSTHNVFTHHTHNDYTQDGHCAVGWYKDGTSGNLIMTLWYKSTSSSAWTELSVGSQWDTGDTAPNFPWTYVALEVDLHNGGGDPRARVLTAAKDGAWTERIGWKSNSAIGGTVGTHHEEPPIPYAWAQSSKASGPKMQLRYMALWKNSTTFDFSASGTDEDISNLHVAIRCPDGDVAASQDWTATLPASGSNQNWTTLDDEEDDSDCGDDYISVTGTAGSDEDALFTVADLGTAVSAIEGVAILGLSSDAKSSGGDTVPDQVLADIGGTTQEYAPTQPGVTGGSNQGWFYKFLRQTPEASPQEWDTGTDPETRFNALRIGVRRDNGTTTGQDCYTLHAAVLGDGLTEQAHANESCAVSTFVPRVTVF